MLRDTLILICVVSKFTINVKIEHIIQILICHDLGGEHSGLQQSARPNRNIRVSEGDESPTETRMCGLADCCKPLCFRLSPLLLFQIKSVETRLPCCVVHWSGAAGDIWPTGPMLTLSYIHMSKANTLELLQSCTKPSMWKISTG